MEIKSKNTNTLMPLVYAMFSNGGYTMEQPSRNGPVIRFKEPVSIMLAKPWQRVNFSPVRDANPFFHLQEALAMLVPFNSVRFMTHFAKTMAAFSDDGVKYNAFYGTRARQWCTSGDAPTTRDQLANVITILSKDPSSRQALVNLWDVDDLTKDTKDKACNLAMLFDVKDQYLCMTSYNRSNDAILGSISGANTVHLSLFQEYVACSLGMPQGPWWHVSNNLHVYTESPKWAGLALDTHVSDPYDDILETTPLFRGIEARHQFDHDLVVFISQVYKIILDPSFPELKSTYTDPFVQTVARPMFNAWQAHKRKQDYVAINLCQSIAAADWRMACTFWLERRMKRTTQPSTAPFNA